MTDLLTAPRGELLKLIYELVEENQALKVQIVELQEENQRLKEKFKDKGRSVKPFFVRPNVQKKKKGIKEEKRNWLWEKA